MASLSAVNPVISGAVATAVSAAVGGDAIPNPRGNVMVLVTNGGGSSITATLAATQTARPADPTFPPMTLGNQAVSIAAGVAKLIGPIPPAFNDVNGFVQMTYSAVTSVTVQVIQPPG